MKEEKNQKGKILEDLENAANFSEELESKAEKMKKDTRALQNDINFYKASVRGSEALIATLELMRSEKGVSVSNVSDILTATMIMFEDRGLIKIIRKK
jgi:hypothetical protein